MSTAADQLTGSLEAILDNRATEARNAATAAADTLEQLGYPTQANELRAATAGNLAGLARAVRNAAGVLA